MSVRLLLSLSLLAVIDSLGPLWAQSACRLADSTSAILKYEIGRYSSATSGDNRIVRDSLRLPLVSESQITVVSQATVCKKANTAFQSYWANRGGTAFSGLVYVLQVGGVYAVQDPAYRYRAGGSYTPILFLDSRYRALSVF